MTGDPLDGWRNGTLLHFHCCCSLSSCRPSSGLCIQALLRLLWSILGRRHLNWGLRHHTLLSVACLGRIRRRSVGGIHAAIVVVDWRSLRMSRLGVPGHWHGSSVRRLCRGMYLCGLSSLCPLLTQRFRSYLRLCTWSGRPVDRLEIPRRYKRSSVLLLSNEWMELRLLR